MKKRLMVAGLLLAGAVSSYGTIVSQFDIANSRSGTLAGWTTWTSADIAAGTPVVSGPLTLSIASTYTLGANMTAQLVSGAATETLCNYDYSNPLMTGVTPLSGSYATDRSLIGDSFGGLSAVGNVRFNLAGLTIGDDYQVQFLGLFKNTAGNNIGITQLTGGGTASHNVLTAPSTGVFTFAPSPIFTFTATGDTASFAALYSGPGPALKQGISGIIVDAIPEPATIGMLGFGAFMVLLLRRRLTRS